MIRLRAFSLVAGVALLAALVCRADSSTNETFPVVHNEPITIHLLDGMSGRPLAHTHLLFFAGYDDGDILRRVWHEEILTDDQGSARLSNQFANLSYVQVWVLNKQICLTNPKTASFSVARIRRDGLSTPNRCGIITVQDAPGIFTVFAKGKAKAAKVKLPVATAGAQTFTPAATARIRAETTAPAQRLVEAVSSAATSHPPDLPATHSAAAVSATRPSVPQAVALKPALSTTMLTPVSVATPVEASIRAMMPTKPPATRPTYVSSRNNNRRHAARRHHATTRRYAAGRSKNRSRRVLAACSTPPPETKTALEAQTPATAHSVPAGKPAAGIKSAAAQAK